MTDGQRSAVEQLREIETASVGVLEILGITEPSEGQSYAFADLSVYCGDMPRVPEGLPLRKRERLRVLIPADFPFEHPSIITLHKRWAGFSHVQWKWVLCLYQSSSTEWIPGDGMFGFIQRLDTWIRRGALNELDPTGAPLHPPVAYVPSGPARSVIPRVDTPEVSERPWFGFAHLRTVSEQRVDICGWSAIGSENTPSGVAAAILLPEPLPFEFPAKVKDLMEELTARGVPQELLLAVLGLSVLRNEEQSPLYVIVGTPMRGIRGGKLRQHLSAWYLDPGIALGLRLALEKYETHERLREIGEECERIVLDWAREAKVSWCRVREDRPEVTIRRDSGSPMTWFVGRTISLWGCGALGSYLGDCLTRAGVRKLILRDAGIVTPGVLARQLFDDADIGRPKVEALGDRLQRIRPDLEIERHYEDLLEGPLARDDWSDGADLVIDATAATAVLAKLEYRRWISPADPVPVVSMAIGHRAEEGLVLVAGAGHSGGPADVSRRTKVATGETPDCRAFLGEFWPVLPRTDVFQPEPGCSENTFVGSAADVAVLAGMMLNYAALELAEPGGVTAGSRLVRQPHTVASDGPIQAGFHWGPDLICHDPHTGYEVRIAPTAWQAMLRWADESCRRRGRRVETGGLLFGERDDAARVVWVSEVSGPPPDSRASAQQFLCGVEGTTEMNREKRERSHGSVAYTGMWHTHPNGTPLPSSTDLDAMERLTNLADPSPSRSLLIIIATPLSVPTVGTYLFSRTDFEEREGTLIVRCCSVQVVRPEAGRKQEQSERRGSQQYGSGDTG